YPADVTAEDVEGSGPVSWPLRELEVAGRADGCGVVLLAVEERAGDLTEARVWALGAGGSSGSPTLESRTWGEADFVARAAERAYAMAGVEDPGGGSDFAE